LAASDGQIRSDFHDQFHQINERLLSVCCYCRINDETQEAENTTGGLIDSGDCSSHTTDVAGHTCPIGLLQLRCAACLAQSRTRPSESGIPGRTVPSSYGYELTRAKDHLFSGERLLIGVDDYRWQD
jgi:hypothetical protein